MTEQALRKMIAAGESTRQEFKSWVKCKDYRQRKDLAVKSVVALANTKGGVLLFGVEDDGTITGCPKSDPQALMEAIYDMTRPSLFTEIEPVETSDGVVLVVSVEKSNSHVATTGGIYYRRLGNVTKPDYPANDVYSPADNSDFSAKIVEGASESDIDLLEVYRLKEKLRIRDAGSALPDLADTTFLDNLNLIRMDKDEVRVTVAGLLFVGKAASIARLLPQAEVIYLHYSDEAQTEYDNRMDMQEPVISILDKLTERIRTYNRLTNVQVGLFRLEVYDFSEAVFQEALLNALAHRSYCKRMRIWHRSDDVKQHQKITPGGKDVLFFDGDAVNGKGGAILKPGFYPVGVHVVAAGKQFCHNSILQDLIYGVRSLEPMPSSRCRMKWFLVCPGVSARFLHGFCTVSKRAKGANRCKIGQRVQKLEVQNLRYIAKK